MPSPFYNIPDYQYQKAQASVIKAIDSWRNLVITIAAENVAMGITQQQKTKLVADTFLPVMMYGQSGSLWEAYHALDAIKITPQMAPFITEERRNWVKNQIIQIISTL